MLQFVQRWLARHDLTSRYSVRYALSAARLGITEIQKDKATQVAAALTYHTLFSLLPTMALVLVILRTFVGDNEQETFKEFVSDAAVQWLEGSNVTGDMTAAEAAQEASEFSATVDRIDETVSNFLDQLQNIDFRSIGAIGVLVFLYAATALLVTVEQAFNQIFGASQARPWHIRLPLYYTTITLAPLVIIAGQVMQSRAVEELASQSLTAWLAPIIAVITPMLTTWIVFYLMYVLIPSAHVRLKPAAIGALISALAWVALLELFSIYVGGYAGASLYGALALVPLALMLVWLNWLIVLFGLEVTYVLQTVSPQQEFGSGKRALDARELCDPRWLMTILAAVAARFEVGKPASLDEIAQQMRVPEGTVRELTDYLVEHGFLHRVEHSDEGADWNAVALARSPATMTVNELFDLWEYIARPEGEVHDLPGEEFLEQLEQRRRAAFDHQTLDFAQHEGAGGASGEVARLARG
ncbi:MAG: YhjD/YihY/BrkB family envelope integrity protein [Pseudomonadota bacterium]